MKVQNMSESGVRLLLDHLLPVGTTVLVELTNRSRTYTCQRPLRVLYSIRQADGEYCVGGTFEEQLTAEELQRLA